MSDISTTIANSFYKWARQNAIALPPGTERMTERWKAEIDQSIRDSKIEILEWVDGKLMGEEPEILASAMSEDYDNAWIKGQRVFSDYIGEEVIGPKIAELRKREAIQQ